MFGGKEEGEEESSKPVHSKIKMADIRAACLLVAGCRIASKPRPLHVVGQDMVQSQNVKLECVSVCDANM